jgi:hypothetical protein
MKTRTKKHPIIIESNPCRAEDGIHRTTPWDDMRDEVLVPVGSMLFVFLICALVISLG